MRLLGPLNVQGFAGLAAAAALVVLLLIQTGETRHWRKQSGQFEQLYHAEQDAFARTVANYRAAAEAARAADKAAADRVRAEQRAINERITHDYEKRLAVLRDRTGRLRSAAAAAGADPCRRGTAPMPGVPAAACPAAAGAGQDRLLAEDAVIATEQAIQLDALIQWVKRQAAIDPNQPR